jgi:hypothetical protein
MQARLKTNIFMSVGRPATQQQEEFVWAVENLLEEHDMLPRTVGRTDFTTGKPIGRIMQVMRECSGTIVIAFERLTFKNGLELHRGENEKRLEDVRLPTVWNQIEAAMSYTMGLPLLAIAESNLRPEGFLEDGYDWFVNWVSLTPESLYRPEFQSAFETWKANVMNSAR